MITRADCSCQADPEASVHVRAEKRQMLQRKLNEKCDPRAAMASGEVFVN